MVALCDSPAGSRCTMATLLSAGSANNLADAASVLRAGAPEGVRSLPWPAGNDGR